MPISSTYARKLGARAGLIGRALGLEPGDAYHPTWGRVNSWPLAVWDSAFDAIENGVSGVSK